MSLLNAAPIEAMDLGRRYRRRGPWALRHFELEVPEGSIAALVGPNGAGKTTFIRLCLGYELPDEGTITIFGREPRRQRTEAVAAIGYVPQTPVLWRDLTIDDHFVLAAAARHRFDVAEARRLIASVGLEPRTKLADLSGGQQAQVALALALASRAPLLLLDEPLAGLDPLARRDFLAMLLDRSRREGVTVILSSHLVADVEPVADWLIVLAGGRSILHGPIADLQRQFGVVPEATRDGVGRFRRVTGEELTLVAWRPGAEPASLEDIVLGHLAGHRSREGLGRG
ncbi:MAG TPA: ABC transporter ATP-binding protein [Candidatus Binatia bacterium]|nr:ABC transporter ATP-binding protein [Candidatus Binatia bacterium]